MFLLTPQASTIPFVPCRFSAFIPSRWYHASRGQTWSPRASMTHFLPSTFSQSLMRVSLNPSSKHDPICAMSVQCVHPISVVPRISWTNVEPSSKHDPLFCHLRLVKVFCVFLLTLEQARTNMCHFSSVKVLCVTLNPPASTIRSVPCWSTVFLLASEKGVALEQARSNLCYVCSVSFF